MKKGLNLNKKIMIRKIVKKEKLFSKKLVIGFLMVYLSSYWLMPASNLVGEQEEMKLVQEVVKLKYVQASTVFSLLRTFSGRWTKLNFDPKLPDTLVISDTPENMKILLEAIRKIDVKPKDIIFTVQAIVGLEATEKPESELSIDPALRNDPLIKEMQKLLKFRAYQLMDTTVFRALDQEISSVSFGPNSQFKLELKPEVVEETPPSSLRVKIDLYQTKAEMIFADKTKGWSNISPVSLISSHLILKSGERVVVGVSRLQTGVSAGPESKALILIISGKFLD